jgi:hypothetical protein
VIIDTMIVAFDELGSASVDIRCAPEIAHNFFAGGRRGVDVVPGKSSR